MSSSVSPVVTGSKAENTVSPIQQAEKKRFIPPVFEEQNGDSAKAQNSVFEPANTPGNKPAQKTEREKQELGKNSFRQKILEAQKAQAESQKQDFIPSAQEKIIPVDAVNIIHAPLRDFREDFGQNFADAQIDYSDEEERLSAHGEGIDNSLHLFDDTTFSEEAKEPLDWQAFLAYCEEHDFPVEYIPLMQGLTVALTAKKCHVKVSSGPQATIFNKVKNQLEGLLCTFLGRDVKIQVTIVAYELVSDEKMREKASNNSQIKLLMKEFGAEIYRCYDIKHERKN